MLRAPCRGRTGSLVVEGHARYPLLQRSLFLRASPRNRTPTVPVRSRARFRYASDAQCRSEDLVGHRGVEPRCTRLSGGPRHRLSRGQRKMEVSRPAASRPPTGVQNPLPPAARLPEESGGPDPQRSPAHPFSGRGLPPGRFTLQVGSPARCEREMAEDGELESQRFSRPAAFQAVPAPWLVHPPERKAEQSKPTVLPAHPLAGEPGAPVRFTFPYRPRDSNPDHPRSERGASTSWTRTA